MPDSLERAKALVIDANTNARMLIVSHLKELGVGTVRAVTKTRDARLALEAMVFDIVVSDNDFGAAQDSGQEDTFWQASRQEDRRQNPRCQKSRQDRRPQSAAQSRCRHAQAQRLIGRRDR